MKLSKILKLANNGRYQAIVKVIAGRRMLLGFERKNKRSSKYRQKFIMAPLDLATLTKPQAAAVETSSLPEPGAETSSAPETSEPPTP